MRRFGPFTLIISTLACAPRSETSRDAGAEGTAATTLAAVAATHAFDAQLERASKLDRAGASFRAWWSGALSVVVPERASGPTRLASAVDPDAWIEAIPRDLRDVAAVPIDRALVYPSAFADGDVVVLAADGALEELRVVRGGEWFAARYELGAGPAVADVRVREGRVEAIDAAGRVAIGSAPAFLVDRAGARRDVVPRVERSGPRTWSLAFEVSLEGLAFPVVVDPVWSSVAMMKTPRVYHGAVTLADGKALVLGGQTTGGTVVSSAERYDPATNTWTDVGSLPWAHETPGVVLLKTGKVLAARDADVALYDPATATWAATGSPSSGYVDAPVLLDDGRVLAFARGGDAHPLIWSEATGTWTDRAAPPVALMLSSTVLLADGRVLVVGGRDEYSKIHTTVQVYDPKTDAWTKTGSLAERRAQATLARLASGKILAAGGDGLGGYVSTSEVYDPVSGTWSAGPSLPSTASSFIGVAPLPGGALVFVEGGVARTWIEGSPSLLAMGSQPAGAPAIATLVPLANGALVTGGFVSAPVRTVSRLVPLALGSSCSGSTPGDCASGRCVDGVCCASACDGACQSCNVAGKAGTCSPLSGAPHAGRSCAPYAACVAGACATSCASDGDCASTSHCVSGACVAKKAKGAACAATRECATGFCVDGVCCDGACGGQCEACDLPTSPGTCAAVTGLPRGGRAACGGTGPCAPVCDGKTRSSCVFLPAGSTPCGENACSAGVETHASTCDGKGACSDVPKACGAYVCGAVTCKSGCGGKADCAPGFLCALGACVPAPGLGEACKSGAECSTGFCVDGVCCGVSSCGAGSTCASKSAPGQCRKALGVACTTEDECEGGACVDGVCCESACGGQCEACDVPGSAGKCVATKGAPRGGRAACAIDASSPCGSRTCDGAERASCAGFAPAETPCRAATCDAGVATPAATCDGEGKCAVAKTIACGAYTCDDDAKACRVRCTDAAHCAPGNLCADGACVPSSATCSADGLARYGADGAVTSCAPFRCKGGECATACGTSDDCAPGLLCSEARCVAPEIASDASGCAVPRRRSSSAGWLALATTVLALVAHRARRRRTLAAALVLSGLAILGCSPRSAPDPARDHDTDAAVASTSHAIGWSKGEETLYPHARAWTVVLGGGDVLLGGGESIGKPERWSASTGKWTEAAWNHVAYDSVGVPLPGAKVLVAGGTSYPTRRLAEVYDAATSTAAATSSTASEHRYAIGAWLPSVGKALVAGGATDSAVVSTAELWTPATGTWAETGAMKVGRVAAASVALATGKVLALGGSSALDTSSALSSVEAYDPAAGTWSLVAPMAFRRDVPAVALLADGRVLVVGGSDGASTISAAEIYAPATNTWTTVAGPSKPRIGATATRLPSGRVLVAGGTADASVEVYDPAKNAWLPAGSLSIARTLPSAAALSDGRVLVIGGYPSATFAATWDVDVFVEQANGATCSGGGECASGFCVDGRCCDRACNGACEACDVTGDVGTCTAISGPPHTGHPACAPYATCSSGACAATCATDADCCGSAAACCTDRACPTGFAGAWCSAGACVAKKAKGASCASATECVSGSCVDGVCCDTACDGQCEACAETGKVGTCVAIAGAPRGTRAACTGIAAYGECGIQCNGTERKGCVYPPATKTCSSAACTAGVESHASTCNGVGLCNDVPKTCGAFACGAAACKTTCAATSDCAAGFVCKSASCVPAPGLGMPCSASAPCEGGLACTDGVCCGEASCGDGRSCGLPAAAGRCAKIDGQACTTDGECGSGACVDGVCCESRCGGQCQACDVVGSEGKCVAVSGTPRGARPACAKGTSACEASSCDGTDGSRCAALAGATVTCRAASCADDVATLAGTCDGKGACAAPITVACAPYRCASSGDACATACSTNDECTKGHDCVAGACVKATARCSSDGVAVIDPEGRRASCLPYRCAVLEGVAACPTRCSTSDECAPGTLCDGSGTCTTAAPAGAAGDEGGGCGVSSRAPRAPGLASCSALAVALAVACARRRARARREA